MKQLIDSNYRMPHYSIDPGEFMVSGERALLESVAGKTLVVALYHEKLKMGGLANFIVPGNIESGSIAESTVCETGIGYIEFLLADIVKSGGRRDELVAKIFGASCKRSDHDFCKTNIQFIHEYFENEKIPVIAEDLGREYYRRVLFIPLTGELYSKRILSVPEMQLIYKKEKDYIEREINGLQTETEFVMF
ncbi:MAG: chemotaxis protein CheD [Spirochaetes bacterium]|nr:chemotaxis protein CheD [Spirochaetota bacterium]MBN2770543.1 chemotaxis protein CheD [Spirochaetota bacterium]